MIEIKIRQVDISRQIDPVEEGNSSNKQDFEIK